MLYTPSKPPQTYPLVQHTWTYAIKYNCFERSSMYVKISDPIKTGNWYISGSMGRGGTSMDPATEAFANYCGHMGQMSI